MIAVSSVLCDTVNVGSASLESSLQDAVLTAYMYLPQNDREDQQMMQIGRISYQSAALRHTYHELLNCRMLRKGLLDSELVHHIHIEDHQYRVSKRPGIEVAIVSEAKVLFDG